MNSGKKYSVLLPLSSSLSDYTSRMYDLFRTLEVVEHRSQIDLFHDLIDVSAIAREQNRETLNLKFRFLSDHNSLPQDEISAQDLGRILDSIQDFFDSIVQEKVARANSLGQANQDITDRTKVSVLGIFNQSSGIRLAFG